MQINGSTVALGAVIGGGVAAAAAFGLDSLIDPDLVQKGAEHTVGQLANNQELLNQGVAYYTPPTLAESAVNAIGDAWNNAGLGSANDVTMQTLQGPVDLDISKLKELLASDSLSESAKQQLQSIASGVINQAGNGTPGFTPVTPDTPIAELSQQLHDLDSFFAGNKPYGNAMATIHPSNIEGLVQIPLSNSGDLYVHPEKFVEHFDTIAKGANAEQLEGLKALKDHLTPALDMETVGIGAGVSGLTGAAVSAMKPQTRLMAGAPRSAQPMQMQLAQEIPPQAQKAQQPWAARAQAEPQMDGSQVLR